MWRAAHQILDRPLILDDPFALRILPPESVAELERTSQGEDRPNARALRIFMAVRSRFAEDEFANAIGRGVRQYVLLGAGLDTFAWRNPYRDSGVRIFEVDHPATQAWKRALLKQVGLPEPPATTYVPVDFERQSLAVCLTEARFQFGSPAFLTWLGVIPYLTLEAFRNTLRVFGDMATGSAAAFDYAQPRKSLNETSRALFDELTARVAKAGEPVQLFFSPEQIKQELEAVNWSVIADLDGEAIRERFFPDRGTSKAGGGVARLMACGHKPDSGPTNSTFSVSL
jgi:methyltransferase (TIGR00027 family)